MSSPTWKTHNALALFPPSSVRVPPVKVSVDEAEYTPGPSVIVPSDDMGGEVGVMPLRPLIAVPNSP